MDDEQPRNPKPTIIENQKGVEKGDTAATPTIDKPEPIGATSEEFKTIHSPVLEVPVTMDLRRANELQGMLNTWWPTQNVQIGEVQIPTRTIAEMAGIYLDGIHVGDTYGTDSSQGMKRLFDLNDFRGQVAVILDRHRQDQAKENVPVTEPLNDPTKI